MDYSRSIKSNIIIGNLMAAFLIGGVGMWAANTSLSGAVISQGMLVVDTNVKKIQHQAGGIVRDIFVHDGDHVKLGATLLRLDQTVSQSNMAILDKNYNEQMARKSRLEAERDGKQTIYFPLDIRKSKDAQEEAALFETRKTAMRGQKEQLIKRIQQLQQEISGNREQIDSKTQELSYVEKELKGVRRLYKKGLSPITRLTALERDQTKVLGERSQITSAIAQANGKIAEINLQIIQIDRDFSTEVGKDLRETEAQLGEVVEKRVAARDQLNRIDIKAPQNGFVHQSTIHTVGGVVAPGETMMLIIPEDSLVVESKIAPNDISQVKLDQKSFLRFTSFNQKTTPDIEGTVTRISADVSTEQNGASYYTIRIAIPLKEQGRLGAVKLVPGMPVEAFIKTGDRTVLAYLVKPLTDQMYRAFREQ